MSVAAVVIGRNEGARLVACLDGLTGQVDRVVYVDSGSTDGSVTAATDRGAQVVALDMAEPFTAARARNVGFNALTQSFDYIQFIDGDCVLRDGWISTASAFLDTTPAAAVVCGRRRERHPGASVYNALADAEWDTPVGQTKACGGDALMRADALRAVGGYRDDLIAGEEPELCVRLRQQGWQIWRLDAEMTWHDADITRFSQWWARSRRAGHAFAEGAALHGGAPEYHWVKETRRALIWGAVIPVLIILMSIFATPWVLIFILIYPAQVLRLSRHGTRSWALFAVLGKFAESWGALQYYLSRVTGRNKRIIEYK